MASNQEGLGGSQHQERSDGEVSPVSEAAEERDAEIQRLRARNERLEEENRALKGRLALARIALGPLLRSGMVPPDVLDGLEAFSTSPTTSQHPDLPGGEVSAPESSVNLERADAFRNRLTDVADDWRDVALDLVVQHTPRAEQENPSPTQNTLMERLKKKAGKEVNDTRTLYCTIKNEPYKEGDKAAITFRPTNEGPVISSVEIATAQKESKPGDDLNETHLRTKRMGISYHPDGRVGIELAEVKTDANYESAEYQPSEVMNPEGSTPLTRVNAARFKQRRWSRQVTIPIDPADLLTGRATEVTTKVDEETTRLEGIDERGDDALEAITQVPSARYNIEPYGERTNQPSLSLRNLRPVDITRPLVGSEGPLTKAVARRLHLKLEDVEKQTPPVYYIQTEPLEKYLSGPDDDTVKSITSTLESLPAQNAEIVDVQLS